MNQPDINPEKLIPKPVLKPVLFSILILVSGIIIGSGATLMVADQFKTKPLPPGPEYMSRRMIEHMVRDLHLSPEQQEQLGPVVKQHMEAMDKIREEARPKIAEELKQMNDGIMAILDEEQGQIWTNKIRRMQDNFPRMHQRRRPGYNPKDRSDPNFRPDDPRPPRPYRNRPPENRERPEAPPPLGGMDGMKEPVPEKPLTE